MKGEDYTGSVKEGKGSELEKKKKGKELEKNKKKEKDVIGEKYKRENENKWFILMSCQPD